ncbi:MAG: hypothetical protein QGF59_16605, partial [Pirellulaceae bacterium]|nr:hypothetical protein [Pirellulaceae bacterium]
EHRLHLPLEPRAPSPGRRCLLADRKPFLLRLDPELLEALRRWADDDLRSLNGQVEFLLRGALRDAGRSPKQPSRRERKSKGHGTGNHTEET